MCCTFPGCLLFGMLFTVVMCASFFRTAFYTITAVLTIFTWCYSTNLALLSSYGAYLMRQAVKKDYHKMLQELQQQKPAYANACHIVILPNYKEDEEMLLQTVTNIGRSAMAKTSIRVVLAMEEREGPSARDKAERLIKQTSHMFADVIATYHPVNLPGDLAGKSSNTQWAYQQTLQQFAGVLGKLDASQVFLTVGDADTLWHPQYFSALAYHALSMPQKQRSWAMWQPPILLTRNLQSVPAATRLSGYGTHLFELSGLANLTLGWNVHFTYSAYSLTLALAAHPLIGGWDRDVIAEDHHMFCKCFFAALWEQMDPLPGSEDDTPPKNSRKPVKVKTQVHPLYVPATSYLVESSEGYWASCWARFQQARRHSQGVSELSYVILQYITLMMTPGRRAMAFKTHMAVFNIAFKMANVHIIQMVQTLSILMATLFLVPQTIGWALGGGLSTLMGNAAVEGVFTALSSQSFGGLAKWAIFSTFGPIPPIGMLMSVTSFLVVQDALSGKFTQDLFNPGKSFKSVMPGMCPESQESECEGKRSGLRPFSLWQSVQLFLMIQSDYFGCAYVTLIGYGLIPVTMACWSLLKRGQKFEYIVAAKPN